MRVVYLGRWIRANWVSRVTTDVMCFAGFGQPEIFIDLHAKGTFCILFKEDEWDFSGIGNN